MRLVSLSTLYTVFFPMVCVSILPVCKNSACMIVLLYWVISTFVYAYSTLYIIFKERDFCPTMSWNLAVLKASWSVGPVVRYVYPFMCVNMLCSTEEVIIIPYFFLFVGNTTLQLEPSFPLGGKFVSLTGRLPPINCASALFLTIHFKWLRSSYWELIHSFIFAFYHPPIGNNTLELFTVTLYHPSQWFTHLHITWNPHILIL